MENLEHKIDRTDWPKGEWDNEPNRVDFVHAGYACLALRNHNGVCCGYVGVPSNHKFYKANYNDVNVDVHGGLTYANVCSTPICHIPQPGMPDDVFWFGFDCNHYMDYSPGMAAIENKFGWEPTISRDQIYRNIEYVTNEIKSLAEQLKALE